MSKQSIQHAKKNILVKPKLVNRDLETKSEYIDKTLVDLSTKNWRQKNTYVPMAKLILQYSCFYSQKQVRQIFDKSTKITS